MSLSVTIWFHDSLHEVTKFRHCGPTAVKAVGPLVVFYNSSVYNVRINTYILERATTEPLAKTEDVSSRGTISPQSFLSLSCDHAL